MDNNSLKLQVELMKFLENNQYPDAYRVSKEILSYINYNSALLPPLLDRIKTGEPWEYIAGYAEFCGLKIKVNSEVLIPRIETEQLVETAEKDIREFFQNENFISPNEKINIIDAGTGSGAIIIALAYKLKDLKDRFNFYGTEVSKTALGIASDNAKDLLSKYGINIAFAEGDVLEGLFSHTASSAPLEISPYNKTIIVANLPYIPTEVYKNLDHSVLHYEPEVALDGGNTGTKVYERLFKQISKYSLNYLEIIAEMDPLISQTMEFLAENMLPSPKSTSLIKDVYERERFLKVVKIDTKF